MSLLERIALFFGFTHRHGYCIDEHDFVDPAGCSCDFKPAFGEDFKPAFGDHWTYTRCSQCKAISSLMDGPDWRIHVKRT